MDKGKWTLDLVGDFLQKFAVVLTMTYLFVGLAPFVIAMAIIFGTLFIHDPANAMLWLVVAIVTVIEWAIQ